MTRRYLGKENALLIVHAIGDRACRAGHAVLYVEAGDMLKQLRAARRRSRVLEHVPESVCGHGGNPERRMIIRSKNILVPTERRPL